MNETKNLAATMVTEVTRAVFIGWGEITKPAIY